MFKILTTCFLMFMPICFASTEQTSILSSPESEIIPEALQQTLVERIRMLTKEYDVLPEEEKENFLSQIEETEESFKNLRAWSKLDWKTEGKHQLPQSHSTISIPDGYILVTGPDAEAVFTIYGDPVPDNLEAYICESKFGNSITFQNFKLGYIPSVDFKEFLSNKVINEIIHYTEEDNKERREVGSPELNVIGWFQEPKLDRVTKTIYWVLEADCGDEKLVISMAIRFGKEGHEMIKWITPKSSYVPFGNSLDTVIRSYSFDQGYRYSDYKAGNQFTNFGIAALTSASIVEGSILQSLDFTVLFKAGGALLVAGLASIFYKLKDLFIRK